MTREQMIETFQEHAAKMGTTAEHEFAQWEDRILSGPYVMRPEPVRLKHEGEISDADWLAYLARCIEAEC